jgi:thymidylate synthase
MSEIVSTEFDHSYAAALRDILDRGHKGTNGRTGRGVRELHGVTFAERGVPILTLRDINIKWFATEAVWFLSGDPDLRLMHAYGLKSWDPFSVNGVVPAGTGYRWRRFAQHDQLEWLISELACDETSRQAVLCSWMPTLDNNLVGEKPLSVPCVPFWHFCVMAGRLNLTVMQRSADVWFGLPHDVAGAGLIQALLARHLDLRPGSMAWVVGNAHLYEDQLAPARRLLKRYDECRLGGVAPNMAYSPERDLMPDAMLGESWVVTEILHAVDAWYTPRKRPAISGPKLVR